MLSYDVVMSQYDGVGLLPIIQELFGTQWASASPYPTPSGLGSTDCLVSYVDVLLFVGMSVVVLCLRVG